MHLNDIETNLNRRRDKSGLIFWLGEPVPPEKLDQIEVSLGLEFPAQVRDFYLKFNGLTVNKPGLKIFPVDQLRHGENGGLLFAEFEGENFVSFAIRELNDAGQWDIVEDATGEKITFTMASFWSNKIWHWIDKERRVWKNEVT